ncbi:electron transfer flavoprotein subunit alpha/FixB family protein [Vulcanisaeta thermophila]|uniref:electron transfer flavoprotein subunit alpha/FixB family protein n=1 Tax=Vulcanisaeta thermophila TaxID=867917 RepID=UPI0008531298|nr:electron transfer flavoprotein subunit alpha/FixB family protein [Vulcanisaeta thermophila]
MVNILIVGSQGDYGLVGLAQRVGDAVVHYLVVGGDATGLERYGVSKAFIVQGVVDEQSLANAVLELARANNYALIISPINKFYRTAMPMVAQSLGAPLIMDVTDLKPSGDTFEVSFNGIGSRAQVTAGVKQPAILMAPPARFKPTEKPTSMSKETLQVKSVGQVKVVSTEEKARGGVRIEDAELIVSVGRGFKKKEDLQLAFDLAKVLGAEIGCSRPIAADLKWLSEDHWVGLSGHKVRPKLYMAIGISGQPQHLAGMMESRVVVVINNDPNAPFFKNCDYGVVEDLYKFVPALTNKLRELLKK